MPGRRSPGGASVSLSCYRCGKEIPENNQGRQDTCTSCGFDTRVCRNCRHYDKAANNECQEEQAGRQVEKEKANFCEWFQPRTEGAPVTGAPGKDDLKKAADALFGGKNSSSSETDAAKSAAEALFKKK